MLCFRSVFIGNRKFPWAWLFHCSQIWIDHRWKKKLNQLNTEKGHQNHCKQSIKLPKENENKFKVHSIWFYFLLIWVFFISVCLSNTFDLLFFPYFCIKIIKSFTKTICILIALRTLSMSCRFFLNKLYTLTTNIHI